jgi:tetratricopeptide (TPR) repeat protein
VEHPKILETGSINDIKKRLLLWAKRSPKGLARVEFSSEFSRQKVLEEMSLTLAEAKIKLHEIVLPSQQEAIVVVEKLLEELNQIESGLVSVTGFSTAFTSKVLLEESIRILNFHRDRLVAPNLNQIWWMTPAFLQTSIHAMPDINSWFSLRLQLKEMILNELPINFDETYSNIYDARHRVHNLLNRFQQAQLSGMSDLDLLTTYLLPALELLAKIGVQKELQDLLLQVEGLLGRLKHLKQTSSPELATSLHRLARLYHAQGKYSDAEPLYLRALEIREQALDKDLAAISLVINSLGELYYVQGKYNEAEQLFSRALEIRETYSDLHVVSSLNDLAAIYMLQRKYDEAELIYLRVIETLEHQFENNHPFMVTVWNNLTNLYEFQGRYKDAETLRLKCLEFEKRVLGENHPQIAASLHNLGGLYLAQGRYDEAEPIYLKALAIREEQLGADHPDVASSLNGLGVLYANMGKFIEAEPLLNRALDIRKNILGEEHPNTVRTQDSLANVQENISRHGKSPAILIMDIG